LVKDEIVDGLLADSHSILNMWKNYFFQLFIEHGINPLELNNRFILKCGALLRSSSDIVTFRRQG
jgi:hypothetical protein